MIGRTILKGLILIASFMCWDLYFKEVFYGIVGDASLGNVFFGYAIVFGAALILGEVVTRALGLKEVDTGEAYQ